jgi:hypothetical protein
MDDDDILFVDSSPSSDDFDFGDDAAEQPPTMPPSSSGAEDDLLGVGHEELLDRVAADDEFRAKVMDAVQHIAETTATTQKRKAMARDTAVRTVKKYAGTDYARDEALRFEAMNDPGLEAPLSLLQRRQQEEAEQQAAHEQDMEELQVPVEYRPQVAFPNLAVPTIQRARRIDREQVKAIAAERMREADNARAVVAGLGNPRRLASEAAYWSVRETLAAAKRDVMAAAVAVIESDLSKFDQQVVEAAANMEAERKLKAQAKKAKKAQRRGRDADEEEEEEEMSEQEEAAAAARANSAQTRMGRLLELAAPTNQTKRTEHARARIDHLLGAGFTEYAYPDQVKRTTGPKSDYMLAKELAVRTDGAMPFITSNGRTRLEDHPEGTRIIQVRRGGRRDQRRPGGLRAMAPGDAVFDDEEDDAAQDEADARALADAFDANELDTFFPPAPASDGYYMGLAPAEVKRTMGARFARDPWGLFGLQRVSMEVGTEVIRAIPYTMSLPIPALVGVGIPWPDASIPGSRIEKEIRYIPEPLANDAAIRAKYQQRPATTLEEVEELATFIHDTYHELCPVCAPFHDPTMAAFFREHPDEASEGPIARTLTTLMHLSLMSQSRQALPPRRLLAFLSERYGRPRGPSEGRPINLPMLTAHHAYSHMAYERGDAMSEIFALLRHDVKVLMTRLVLAWMTHVTAGFPCGDWKTWDLGSSRRFLLGWMQRVWGILDVGIKDFFYVDEQIEDPAVLLRVELHTHRIRALSWMIHESLARAAPRSGASLCLQVFGELPTIPLGILPGNISMYAVSFGTDWPRASVDAYIQFRNSDSSVFVEAGDEMMDARRSVAHEAALGSRGSVADGDWVRYPPSDSQTATLEEGARLAIRRLGVAAVVPPYSSVIMRARDIIRRIAGMQV